MSIMQIETFIRLESWFKHPKPKQEKKKVMKMKVLESYFNGRKYAKVKHTYMTKNVSQGEINWNEEIHKDLPLNNQDDKPCTQIVVGDYTNALVGMVAILQQSYSGKIRILTTTPTTHSRKQNHSTQPKSQNSKCWNGWWRYILKQEHTWNKRRNLCPMHSPQQLY